MLTTLANETVLKENNIIEERRRVGKKTNKEIIGLKRGAWNVQGIYEERGVETLATEAKMDKIDMMTIQET